MTRLFTDNARYAKLRWQVGKRHFDLRKIREAKELLNSTMLSINGECHIFLKEVVKIFGGKSALIGTLNNIHSLVCIKLAFIIRHVRGAVPCDQYAFTIESPIIYSRGFFCASEKRIFSVSGCSICIKPASTDTNAISQNFHEEPFA